MKDFGSGINKGFPGHIFIASDDYDQFFFKQFLNGIITIHAADGFDFSLGDGLFVGNDGKRFQCCSGKTFQEFFPIQLGDGFMK